MFTCYNMDEPWGRYAKWNKSVTKKTDHLWVHLHEVPRVVKFTETEWWLSGAGEEGNWFDGYSIPILQDGKSSEDWLHYANALNTTELTVKND